MLYLRSKSTENTRLREVGAGSSAKVTLLSLTVSVLSCGNGHGTAAGRGHGTAPEGCFVLDLALLLVRHGPGGGVESDNGLGTARGEGTMAGAPRADALPFELFALLETCRPPFCLGDETFFTLLAAGLVLVVRMFGGGAPEDTEGTAALSVLIDILGG